MNHFYKQITDESYFSFEDIYRRMVEIFPSGSTFVEVGVLHGQSLAYLGVEVVNSGKEIQIIGIDNFKWSDKQLEKARNNLLPLSGKTRVALLVDTSDGATDLFADGLIEFVFIDADHSYDAVRRDIAAWLSKIRPGGVIGGHDYCKNSFPGVVQAVDEAFGDRVKFSVHTCWEVDV